jgi:hypothetical protein
MRSSTSCGTVNSSSSRLTWDALIAGVVAGYGVRERHGQRFAAGCVILGGQAEGRAEPTAGSLGERPSDLFFELGRERRGRAEQGMLEVPPGLEELRPVTHHTIGSGLTRSGGWYAGHEFASWVDAPKNVQRQRRYSVFSIQWRVNAPSVNGGIPR